MKYYGRYKTKDFREFILR